MSNWIAIEQVPDRALAQPLVDLLMDRDIPARVQSDDCGGVDPSLGFVHGIWLEVPSEHVEAARGILAEWKAPSE